MKIQPRNHYTTRRSQGDYERYGKKATALLASQSNRKGLDGVSVEALQCGNNYSSWVVVAGILHCTFVSATKLEFAKMQTITSKKQSSLPFVRRRLDVFQAFIRCLYWHHVGKSKWISTYFTSYVVNRAGPEVGISRWIRFAILIQGHEGRFQREKIVARASRHLRICRCYSETRLHEQRSQSLKQGKFRCYHTIKCHARISRTEPVIAFVNRNRYQDSCHFAA